MHPSVMRGWWRNPTTCSKRCAGRPLGASGQPSLVERRHSSRPQPAWPLIDRRRSTSRLVSSGSSSRRCWARSVESFGDVARKRRAGTAEVRADVDEVASIDDVHAARPAGAPLAEQLDATRVVQGAARAGVPDEFADETGARGIESTLRRDGRGEQHIGSGQEEHVSADAPGRRRPCGGRRAGAGRCP